jgi:hypothetical protein
VASFLKSLHKVDNRRFKRFLTGGGYFFAPEYWVDPASFDDSIVFITIIDN